MILKKGGRLLGALILFFLCAAFFCLIALLIVKPGAKDSPVSAPSVQAEFPDPVPPLVSGNAQALSRAFSHPLPFFSGYSFEGEVRTVPFEGNSALMATLSYPSFTVVCVQPALAAPLLLRDSLTPASVTVDNQSGFSILSMPAVYMKGGHTHYFFFSDDSAAYAVYTDQADLSSLVTFASSLRWVT